MDFLDSATRYFIERVSHYLEKTFSHFKGNVKTNFPHIIFLIKCVDKYIPFQLFFRKMSLFVIFILCAVIPETNSDFKATFTRPIL